MGGTGEAGRIRVGIGGWSYEPWRGSFYPKGLPHARELEYASRQITTIEINGTFYRTQKPESFARWRDETPEGFVFSVKAPRYTVNRKVLADAGPLIEGFVASGVGELREKLGPILWQFAPTKRYEREDVAAFLDLLPKEIGGRRARNVLEARHQSFCDESFVELARRNDCAIVFSDSKDYPRFGDLTADFVYARLLRSDASMPTGYPTPVLDAWAKIARTFARGGQPNEFPRIAPLPAASHARDVFILFINGAKERAPAAARELLSRLG